MDFLTNLDNEQITTILRIVVVGILAICAIVTRKITNLVGNTRLSKMAKRLERVFVLVVIARALATYIDANIGFEIGFFSNIVNTSFYLAILYLLIRLYRRLKADIAEIHQSGGVYPNPAYIDKKKVSQIFDELFDELKINIEKTNKLERQMRSHLL